MAKTKISEYSATAANNTDVESVNIAEGCAPSGINNAIREVMAHLKDFQTGVAGDSLTVGGTLTSGTVDINGGAIDGTSVGATTPSTGAFTSLSASGATTLSGGTANGVTYLNGSKVLTSGSALTFDGTTVSATSGITGTKLNTAGAVNLYNDTASSITHFQQLSSAYSASYIQSVISGATGNLVFATAANWTNGNAVERMRLTSTGLGIGTSSPISSLDVRATAGELGRFAITNSGAGYLLIGGGPSTSEGLRLTYDNSDGSSTINNFYNAPLKFSTNNTERLRIDSSGNLGLGVTPSAWFSSGSSKAFETGGPSLLNYSNTLGILVTGAYLDSTGTFKYKNSNKAYYYAQDSVTGYHGWFNAPSGTAGATAAFTQAMTLTSAGHLGIGTSAPVAKLAVVGGTSNASNLSTAYSLAAFNITPKSTSGYSLQFGSGPADVPYIQMSAGGAAAGNLLIQPYGGNVGIGTTAPAALLSFGSTASGASDGARIYLRNNTNEFAIGTNGSQSVYAGYAGHVWQTGSFGGTERMRIDSAGNVGIGTSSPSVKLQVNGASTASALRLNETTSNRNTYLGFIDTSGNFGIDVNDGGYLRFAVNGAERARIDSSGNLLVGETAVDLSGGLAVIPGYATGAPAILAFNKGNTSGETCLRFKYQGTQVGAISYSSSATTYATSSDYRLKEDWQPMTGASERVKALNPVNFAWKADGSRVDGFLAHEAQAVVPEAVHGEKDAVDADGNPDYQGIDQSKLVPLLTAALQEALAQIDSLTARVSALEGN